MRLTPDREALREQVVSIGARLRRSIEERVRFERQRVHHAEARPVVRDPRQIARARRESVEVQQRRLEQALRSAAEREHRRISGLRLRLERKRPGEVHARRPIGPTAFSSRSSASTASRS